MPLPLPGCAQFEILKVSIYLKHKTFNLNLKFIKFLNLKLKHKLIHLPQCLDLAGVGQTHVHHQGQCPCLYQAVHNLKI